MGPIHGVTKSHDKQADLQILQCVDHSRIIDGMDIGRPGDISDKYQEKPQGKRGKEGKDQRCKHQPNIQFQQFFAHDG